MPLFIWKPSYELNVPEIDQQHRRLVGLINELYDAMKEARGQEALDYILGELQTYIHEHFATEERLMKSCRYPDYEEHVVEHHQLGAQVEELIQRRSHGGAVSTQNLMSFLCRWLREHLAETDKAFGQFIKRNR